jgi:hypothetical protein
MVRRGSTVRVRQRASIKCCKSALSLSTTFAKFQYAVHVEPFMEPSGSGRTLQSVENAHIRHRAPADAAFVPVVDSTQGHCCTRRMRVCADESSPSSVSRRRRAYAGSSGNWSWLLCRPFVSPSSSRTSNTTNVSGMLRLPCSSRSQTRGKCGAPSANATRLGLRHGARAGHALRGARPGPRRSELVGRRLFVVALLVVAGSALVGASR